jgi:hypothetical protein
MKKILTISALLGSLFVFAPSQEAKAAELANAALNSSNAIPQIRLQIGRQNRNRRWNNRRASVTTQTRIVRRGFRTYRETYRITYMPNGRTRTQLISRVMVGGRRNY